MKKGFWSSVFGAVVGLALVGSGVALGQSDAGPIDGGSSASLALGEFLRTHKRVELAIPALDRLSLGFRPDLVLEDGTVFSVGNGSDSGCRAPLRIDGGSASGNLCVPGPADCGDESGGFWLPHGRRDTPGGRVVELIQGSRNSELLKVAELRLRGAFWDEWRDAVGLRLPVLVRGPPARHPRVETQIFFPAGEDAKRLAGVTARLLGPVVGVVEPRPWPGSSASAVVVVVGEKVVVGGSRAE